MTGQLPSGTVTFLFTDIEGSTELWERRPDEMRAALADHDAVLHSSVARHGGYVFATAGDGIAAAFDNADDGLAAAIDAQGRLRSSIGLFGVRMGLHAGAAAERAGDYFGQPVNRAARVMAAGQAGQILVTEAVAGLLTSDVEVVDLGLHRLRDLLSPVRLYQVGTEQFPPLATLDRHHHNLPELRSASFGIADAIADVAATVEPGTTVTLTGVGGVGKTRLAVEVAAASLDRFDSTWFLDLVPAASTEDVGALVAAVLGLSGPGRSQLTSALQRRTTLVVFDNCEHVLDGAADHVELVQGAGGAVLATSREPLGVDGERVVPIRSLTTEPARQLFVDRARSVQPDLDLTDAIDDVDEICAQLDGLPLAIELAASRVSHLSVADIAAHLDERFQLLLGGRRRSRRRHQTLQATMDWSYQLLSDAEAALLRTASVFSGGFSLRALAGVNGTSELETLDLLGSLIDKSLVQATTGSDGASRYALLETVRLCGLDRLLERAEIERRREAHAAWFRDQWFDAHPIDDAYLDGVAREPYFLAAHDDIDNEWAALEWWAATGGLVDLGRHASYTIGHLTTAGRTDPEHRFFGRDDVAEALATADQPPHVSPVLAGQEQALYHLASAMAANAIGAWDDVRSSCEAGLRHARAPSLRAILRGVLANVMSIIEPARSTAIIDEALTEIDRAQLPNTHRWLLERLTDGMIMSGEYAAAAAHLESLVDAGGGALSDFGRSELAYVLIALDEHDRLEPVITALGRDGTTHTSRFRGLVAATIRAARTGDESLARECLIAAAEALEDARVPLLDVDLLLGHALVHHYGGDSEHASRLLAIAGGSAIRSPGTHALMLHAIGNVKATLPRSRIAEIRSEAADTTVGAALAAELMRLRSLDSPP